MMDKYIGIIYWNDDSGVLDNTTVSSLMSVWKQCCKAHKLYAGEIVIRKAEYNKEGQVVGDVVKRFDSVEDCQDAYEIEYNQKESR